MKRADVQIAKPANVHCMRTVFFILLQNFSYYFPFPPTFSGPANFRPKNFSGFQLSLPKFSARKNFTAKKRSVSRPSTTARPAKPSDVNWLPLQIAFTFFQLSRRIFLDFSGFESEKISRKIFRGKKDPDVRPFCSSYRKFSGKIHFMAKKRSALKILTPASPSYGDRPIPRLSFARFRCSRRIF